MTGLFFSSHDPCRDTKAAAPVTALRTVDAMEDGLSP